MKYYAVIVAGGTGSRMKSAVPKQFMLINGKPVLMHTIGAFQSSKYKPEILLVLNKDYHSLWSELCSRYNFDGQITVVENGEQRFHSVKNALKLISDNSITAIHDAVRPVVSVELIDHLYQLTAANDAVIPVIPCRDSIRKKEENTTRALNREDFFLVQTPQVFQSAVLKKAYLQEYNLGFTDDATVVEATGIAVATADGDFRNIKITYPEDFIIAEAYLKEKA